MRQILLILLILSNSRVAAQTSSNSVSEQAIKEIQAGRPAAAQQLLQSSLKSRPADYTAWNLLGIAEAELDHPSEAETAFKQALKLKPDLLPGHENLGLLLFKRKQYSGAANHLGKAMTLGSRNPDAALDYGAALLKLGNSEKATTHLAAWEAQFKDSQKYWLLRGTAELERHDFPAADRSFQQALATGPESLVALNGAAAAAEGQHDVDKAIALRYRARQFAPDDVPTLVLFGQVALQRDLIDDAAEALEHAYQLAPDNNTALYLLASAKIGLEQYPEAHGLMTEFARRVPDFANSYYSLGWIDLKMNNKDRAYQEFQKCLELSPNHQHALYEMARIHLTEGRLEEAEQGFRKVLELNPQYARAQVGLGDLYARKSQIDEARAMYEEAIQKDPDLPEAHYQLSLILYRQKNKAGADRERKTAEDLNQAKKTEGRTWLRIVTAAGELSESAKQ